MTSTDMTFSMPSNLILLCGIKHSGKSLCGKALAAKLGIAFADSDEVIETLYRREYHAEKSCREIFREKGETFFKDLECRAATLIAEQKPIIAAAGGGLCDNPPAVSIYKAAGAFFVFLDEPQMRLYERIVKSGIPPFLESDDPKAAFSRLYERRRQLYRETADATLTAAENDEPVDRRTQRLTALLKEFQNGGTL